VTERATGRQDPAKARKSQESLLVRCGTARPPFALRKVGLIFAIRSAADGLRILRHAIWGIEWRALQDSNLRPLDS